MRALLGAALAGLVGFLLATGMAGPAAAHASLIDTDPAEGAVLATAPEQVTFTFDEPVRLPRDAVHVFDATGTEVPATARSVDTRVVVALPGRLTDGTYVVSWRVVSTDAHPIAGSLSFSVGAPSAQVADVPQADSGPAVTIVQGAVQAVQYLGLFASAGLALFCVLLLPDGSARTGLRRRLRRVVVTAGGVAVLAAVLLLPITTVHQRGTGLAALADISSWTDRVMSAGGLMVLLLAAGLAAAAAGLSRAPGGSGRWVTLAGASVALGSVAVVGHSRAYGPAALVIATDVLHVVTAAVWFGGLLGLTLSLRALSSREHVAARALTRFSVLAAGMLVALTVAGSVLAWRILGSWAALVETRFGIIFLVKVGIVALTVAVAGWNRYRLLPQVADPGIPRTVGPNRSTAAGPRLAAGALRRTVRLEAALLVVVLALTGFLVDSSPEVGAEAGAEASPGAGAPRAGSPGAVTATAGELHVIARVRPQRVGRNTIVVQIHGPAGPVKPYEKPTVSLSSEQEGVDLGSRPVTKVAPGTYRLSAVIPTAGTWQIQVSVRTGKFENPVAVLRVPIGTR